MEEGNEMNEAHYVLPTASLEPSHIIGLSQSTSEQSRLTLAWNDLSVCTRGKNPKVLLNSCSGTIQGGLWAIMGESGGGKTTLLSVLALRLDTTRRTITGDLSLNGQSYCKNMLKSMSAYVMQDDLLNAHLTVEETLAYTAELRMPANTTVMARTERIECLLELMGIAPARHVYVGDTRFKGVSGGERKRLCIAMELLTRPLLLFLDEPTSGLDSSTALSVVKILKTLASKGECIVITSIHQPQTKIFDLLDNLILIAHGNIIYQGNSVSSLDYFASQGYPCPLRTNPADHIVEVLTATSSSSSSNKEGLSLTDKRPMKATLPTATVAVEKGGGFIKAMATAISLMPLQSITSYPVPIEPDFGTTSATLTLKEWLPWRRQFSTLYRRSLHLQARRYDVFLMNLAVTVLIAVLTSTSVWRDMGTHKGSTAKRPAALFFCVIHQGIVASLQGTHSFPLERALMLRERAAGTYYVSAYFLAKSAADFTFQFMIPIIYACIVYPMVGFSPGWDKFLIFTAFMLLTSQAAVSVATLVSTICVSIEMSTVVLAAAYEICRLYGGWFIPPALLNSYKAFRFLDAISYIKYAFVGISLNENKGLLLTCTPAELTPPHAPGPQTAATCKIPPLAPNYYPYSGANLDQFYGFNRYSIELCACMLVVYILLTRIGGYLGLRYIKR